MPSPIPFSLVIAVLVAIMAAGCEREPAPEANGQADTAAVEAPKISLPGAEPTGEPVVWIPASIELDDADAAAALAWAEQALAEGDLYEGRESAIVLYLALRRHQEYQAAADTGLLHAARAVLAEGQEALAGAEDELDALQQAQWDAAVLRALYPVFAENHAQAVVEEIAAFLQQVERAGQVWDFNSEGERELQAGRLGENGGGALAQFRAANALLPGQARAGRGLAEVETALIGRAEQAARNDDFATAGAWLAHAGKVREQEGSAVEEAAALIERLRSTRISHLRAQAAAGLGEYGGIHKARGILQRMQEIALDPDDLVLADLRARIEMASHYGAFGPGQMFIETLRDGGRGPQMVVIAHGEFQMGAVPGDTDAHGNERPSRLVRFERGFALSVYEVTVAEFARFINATGYQPRAVRRGFSMAYDERSGNFVRRSGVDWRSDYLGILADEAMPLVHVSALDAAAYAEWLSAQTGAVYRLPSEAEFEYALRAGSSGRYPWPEPTPPAGAGNLTGSEDRSPGGRAWSNAFSEYADGYWGPAPVGQFAANAWGVHDLAGNVSEWVADCWHDSYRRAPADGSAWVNPGCRDQVIRGGSWASSPAQTRASWRAPASVDTTNARIGFRVVRVL